MNSFDKVTPSIINAKNINANDPKKNIPSTAAKAITLSPKEPLSLLIYFSDHTAFFSFNLTF